MTLRKRNIILFQYSVLRDKPLIVASLNFWGGEKKSQILKVNRGIFSAFLPANGAWRAGSALSALLGGVDFFKLYPSS